MSVLANILSDLSTDLDAVSGFAPYLPNREASDTTGTCHRKYKLRTAAGSAELGATQAGGTSIEVLRTLELIMHWNPEGIESTVEGTIADDELSIFGVMLKVSNWPSGTRTILPGSITREDVSTTMIRITYEFEARYLEQGTFT